MTITQYKVGKHGTEQKTYAVKLFDIFPKNIEALALSTAGTGELLRLSVEFEYRNWINMGIVPTSPTLSQSMGESQENRGQGGAGGPDAQAP